MIKSVRIRNFRSIEELTFQPLEKGITGILGPTGAGKSSILSAVLYALFGVRPDRVTVKDLRRDGSSSSDECSVSVLFTDAGQEVEVIREIKGAAGRVIANIYVDGIEQTVTTPTAAVNWVRERLGIDETGFMTAFVVRQKELEDIVSSDAAKRKEQIEKLAGIDTLGDALRTARKDENLSKELLKNLPGTREEVEEAEARLNAFEKNAESFMLAYNRSAEIKAEAQTKCENVHEELSKLEQQSRKIEQARNNESNIKKLIETNESLLASVEYIKDVSETFNLQEMRDKHKEMFTEINAYRNDLSEAQLEERNYKTNISNLRTQIDQFSDIDPELFLISVEDLQNEIDVSLQKKADMLQKQHQSKARMSDFQESVDQLQHSDDCPTCYTHLEDKQRLLDSLASSIENYRQEIAESVKALSTLSEQQENNSKKLEQTMYALQERARQNQIKEQFDSLVAEPFDEKIIETLKDKISVLEVAMEKSAEQGTKAKNIERDREVYNKTKSDLSNHQQQLTEVELILSELLKSFDGEKAQLLKSDQIRYQNEYRVAENNFASFETQKQEQERQVAIAENYLNNTSGQWKAKQELLKKTEKQALTRDLIEKYRKDTIASLTPELSENASLLISEMTSGAFVTVNVSEDFNITAETRAGRIRKVSELSGGEEAAVALSLRLAIAALITGGNQELAWLDEVLTAQDPDRRASMLSTIRDLSIRQIIMINHTAEAADIADRIVTLEGGAIVTAADNAEAVYSGENLDYDSWDSLAED